MLYKFKSASSGDLIMLGANGDELMRVLGREPAASGIIEVAAMAEAMARIKAAVAAAEAPREDDDGNSAGDVGGDAQGKRRVGLRQRLWPMLLMLERALADKVPIVWGV